MDLLRETILKLSGLTFQQENVSDTLQFIVQRCKKRLPDDVNARLEPFFALNTKIISIDDCDFTQDVKVESIKLLSEEEKKSKSNSWIFFAEIKNRKVALKLSFEPNNAKKNKDSKALESPSDSKKLNNDELLYRNDAAIEKKGESDLPKDNSLEIERLIYRKVLNQLIMCGYTPHVVVYYGDISCNNFIDVLNDKIQKKDSTMYQLAVSLRYSEAINPNFNPMPPPFTAYDDDEEPLYDMNRMRALISEQLVGESFKSIIMQYSVLSPKSMQKRVFEQIYLPILVQIFYTLAVFTEVGLVHNDIHLDNIFVQKYEKEIENCYLINSKLYNVSCEYQSRIYDFDRGSKIKTQYNEFEFENTLLSKGGYCQKYGQCKEVDERREIFTICFFAYLMNNQKNVFLSNFLQKIVPKDLLERNSLHQVKSEVKPGQTLAWYGRLCACREIKCETCSLIHDTRIKTIKEIFDLEEMNQFSVKTSTMNASFIWTLPSETLKEE